MLHFGGVLLKSLLFKLKGGLVHFCSQKYYSRQGVHIRIRLWQQCQKHQRGIHTQNYSLKNCGLCVSPPARFKQIYFF